MTARMLCLVSPTLLMACGNNSSSTTTPPLTTLPLMTTPPVTTDPVPVPAPVLSFTTVDTIAGQVGVRGSAGGKGSQATFNYPVGLAATGAAGAKNGDTLLYIAGLTENIRYAQVGYADNPVSTVIGKGESGSVDGDATTARVRALQGIAVGYGDDACAYWTEDDSCVVRTLTRYPLNGNRKAATVAGQTYKCGAADGPTAGQSGSADGMGAAARFSAPKGLAMDRAENLYLTDNTTVRKITPSGVVTTLAGKPNTVGYTDGPALDACFSRLGGIATDENKTVYVADSGNHVVRRITASGVVSTVAGVQSVVGNADGTISAATFDTPTGLAYFNKQLFVSDSSSQTIRRIR